MWRKASRESGSGLQPSPPALQAFPQPKMAAGVDFGDLELFEAFDPPEESTPKPVHTRFKDDEEEEDDDDDENGVGDAELQEQLRRCEATIEQLRAENILPARWAGCHLALGVWVAAGGGHGGISKKISIRSPSSRDLAGGRESRSGCRSCIRGPRAIPSPRASSSAHHPGPPTQSCSQLL